MSAVAVARAAPSAGASVERVQRFLSAFRGRLRDRRFWAVQAMVLGVTFAHGASELFDIHPQGMEAVYFIPASLYFFPVLYASLNFGKEGAIPTALWSASLAIPNILLWHHGVERMGEVFQVSLVVFLAAIVATRVDREVVARHRAEEQEMALRLSELKYHSLFDSAGQAIVVLDSHGVVREANEAAASLFGVTHAQLKGAAIERFVGREASAGLAARPGEERWLGREFAFASGVGELWLEPLCTPLPDAGDGLLLVLFRDVTARRGFQSYAREIVRAQEEERQRISRELHDVSLQAIVLLCRRLDEVEDAAEGVVPQHCSEALHGARDLAESIGNELRRFSRDLRPSVLDDLGLVPAIRSSLAEMSERSGIETAFIVRGSEARLAPGCEVALFRICQEALRNVERHAHASRVMLRLTLKPEEVQLSVKDNGRGFNLPPTPTNLATAGRLGLLGMQERATLAGGEFRIASTPGKGTRVTVTLPGGCSRDCA